MCATRLIFAFIFLIASTLRTSDGYSVLGVFPTASPSHFFIGNALMRSLAEKGHNVTMIAPYPMKDTNYRGIEVPSTLTATAEVIKDFFDMRNLTILQSFLSVFDLGIMLTNSTLNEPNVQELIKSKPKFDVIVQDLFVNEALYGLSELFNAPVVGFGLFGANLWNTELVGTPSPPSYIPNPFSDLTDHMTLLQRVQNLVTLTVEKIFFDYAYLPRQEELFHQHFPNSKHSLDELRKNTSLVLLNQHVSLSFPRPYLPNMVEVGGLQVNRKRKPLPADMQKFIDEAKHGVIYFSMGSNLKSKNFPIEKRDAIIRTFRSLKQRVLWKFEDPNLPGKSDNVFISKWFPQDDILAHPNVKLFITHGGLLSTIESIYHGKPIIGIPVFGDQFLNMARYEAQGFAVTVDYNGLSEESLKAAITAVLTDPKFTERVRGISERYRDQPMEPMELAIYWVEHVARHKGAPHLHCGAQELNFIQYHNLDAIILLYGGIALVAYFLVRLLLKVAAYAAQGLAGKGKQKMS